MIGKYLKYKLTAHYWHGHHVHSPYTYWIMTNVVYERWPYYSFDKIEGLRKKTGSSERGKLEAKYCQLMQRLCATNNAKNIVLIGYDEGWEAMYLAANDTKAYVTVNGVISKNAKKRLQLLGVNNVRQGIVNEENIDMMVCLENGIKDTFGNYANKMKDGGIMMFSNIHAQEKEWNDIKNDERVRVSMDLYKIGICWLRSEMQKESYVVKF